MELSLIEKWALAHHGLVTRRRAEAAGLSRDAWYRALRSGRLELIHPGVARFPGSARTTEQRIHAAVLATGGSAMASHRSASFLWGHPRPSGEDVDVIVRPGDPHPRLVGVNLHRPRDLVDLQPSTRDGIPTTNPLRTLCDLAAVEPGSVAAAVEHVIVAGYARPSALRALVARHGRSGRTGVVALRDAVMAWPLGDKPADSVLEPAMSRLLSDHGLPPAQFHAIVEGYEVDFLLVGVPVVIECDSWEYHVTMRDRWQRDRERDAVLAAAGYVTIRLTYEHITRRAAGTAARIERVVRRWSAVAPA